MMELAEEEAAVEHALERSPRAGELQHEAIIRLVTDDTFYAEFPNQHNETSSIDLKAHKVA